MIYKLNYKKPKNFFIYVLKNFKKNIKYNKYLKINN